MLIEQFLIASLLLDTVKTVTVLMQLAVAIVESYFAIHMCPYMVASLEMHDSIDRPQRKCSV